jgi:23S rRNA (adenine2503-C2)-methyltransferase
MQLPSLYTQTPESLLALAPPNDAAFLFSRVQRSFLWQGGAPQLGKDGRAFLARHFDSFLPEVQQAHASTDGSTKLALRLADGAVIECVHMPREVKNPRVTLCLSSQVGCAMGCTFCATATMGLVRNLTVEEIVGQVLVALRDLGPADASRITLVFMGMGEPLHNYDNVMGAIRLLADSRGLGIPLRRITVSTSGLVPQIERLAREPLRPCLALSVNATTDAARLRTMPITKVHNLAALRAALLGVPLRSHEKITIEYVLLAGENDSADDARRLHEFCSDFRHNINVIPYNSFEGTDYHEPCEDHLQAFVKVLQDLGSLVTVRRSRGRDAAAACGQLVRLESKRKQSRALAT